VAPAPTLSDLHDRLHAVARHISYLDRRFDDSNNRLDLAERNVEALLDDVVHDLSDAVDTALDRAVRRALAAVACIVLCHLVVLVALLVGPPWA
jgi:hypothetical protein